MLKQSTATRAAGAVLFAVLGITALGATSLHHTEGRGHNDDADIVNVGVQDIPDLANPQTQQCSSNGPGVVGKPCIP